MQTPAASPPVSEREEILSLLRAFIRRQFRIADNDPEFTDDVNLYDYGYVDSFGAVELLSFITETFSITVGAADQAGHQLNSMTKLATFIRRRQAREV